MNRREMLSSLGPTNAPMDPFNEQHMDGDISDVYTRIASL